MSTQSKTTLEKVIFDLYHNNIESKAELHVALRSQVFDQLLEKIKATNIKKQFIEAMFEGYCGFTLYMNPYIISFTKNMQMDIIDAINNKLVEKGIFSMVFTRFVGTTVTIELRYVNDIGNIMICKPYN
jgi:hypothetical protein